VAGSCSLDGSGKFGRRKEDGGEEGEVMHACCCWEEIGGNWKEVVGKIIEWSGGRKPRVPLHDRL
jgi:hypothetical protein